ncbi:cysteine proteinase [Dendrothele bispora CBS 962.96]|uniref:ubiquitinyl hydrolase 1 n=1 Tax=Dendrothele bispora (strain CBS 962.96) TaxID=1314807 RepID=A0A4S8LFG9_DENBC|nr:cysteine proteinase [Dendrothele bispora CBS 962.96]
MAPKHRRHVSPSSQGLATGERLDRDALVGNATSPWGWVGKEASKASEITHEHLLTTCGLSIRNPHSLCRNKFTETSRDPSPDPLALRDTDGGVIVISDDDEPVCSKKSCKNNPFCLNYLGQGKWEGEFKAGMKESFMKLAKLGDDPSQEKRHPDLPVGLKNLGATCYANASLQVWFRDLAFRAGVYECKPLDSLEDKFQESPIFQLQVTFAALQNSEQNVYNPTKLVESLQLRTGEQQDAQEFSKLFMSHLDAEFKKQPKPSLRTLINDQFEGKLLYGTTCKTCRYQSERSSDFLELEVNFQNNRKLEDCIDSILETETLSGDNKYLCPQCDSLRDAIRKIQLTSLPPVLHFSLLRFVYDTSTMERKKSKSTILFPKRLNMNRFVSSVDDETAGSPQSERNVYELCGILLHKGASAYHGHYEAQVFDSRSQSWYQFNDEVVTRIKSLGDKEHKNVDVNIEAIDETDNDIEFLGAKRKKSAMSNPRKRQRVDDSEVETLEQTPPRRATDESRYISSRDAYMLIYTRVTEEGHSSKSAESPGEGPSPPSRAMEIVGALNDSHKKACEEYSNKFKAMEDDFVELAFKVKEIYGDWNVSSPRDDSVVVSRQALENWLSRQSIQSVLSTADGSADENLGIPAVRTAISINDVLCEHGKLDHRKSAQMKVITRRAYEKIAEYTKCSFDHILSPSDVCKACIEVAFHERLYQVEHPRLVKQFTELLESETQCIGYWISRAWVKDWCLQRPKMHKISKDDPGPDAPEYDDHVRCEHGGLSPNAIARRQISVEATEVLTNLFPSWRPLSSNEEICSICDVMHYENKSNNLRHRKQAEEEKARLRQMYDYIFESSLISFDDGAYALASMAFLRHWKQWLNKPTEAGRPDTIDNEQFLCKHQRLWIDPNCSSDLHSAVAIIKRPDWDTLSSLYPGGRLIAIERCFDDNAGESRFFFEPPVCNDCRYQRKTEWDSTEVIVRLSNGKTASRDGGPTTYKRHNGARQSRRLREVRENGEKRRLTITKSMSVKEIKVLIQEEFNIPTICQSLFYDGKELDDNNATAGSLQIFAHSTLELREVHMISDSEDVAVRKREEGLGFTGTVLGCRTMIGSSDPQVGNEENLISCSACTFANSLNAVACDMCNTILEGSR